MTDSPLSPEDRAHARELARKLDAGEPLRPNDQASVNYLFPLLYGELEAPTNKTQPDPRGGEP